MRHLLFVAGHSLTSYLWPHDEDVNMPHAQKAHPQKALRPGKPRLDKAGFHRWSQTVHPKIAGYFGELNGSSQQHMGFQVVIHSWYGMIIMKPSSSSAVNMWMQRMHQNQHELPSSPKIVLGFNSRCFKYIVEEQVGTVEYCNILNYIEYL